MVMDSHRTRSTITTNESRLIHIIFSFGSPPFHDPSTGGKSQEREGMTNA